MTPLNKIGVLGAGKLHRLWYDITKSEHDVYDDNNPKLANISECNNEDVFIAIGLSSVRENLFNKFSDRNFISAYGEFCHISESSVLDKGCLISNFSTIHPNVKIGKGLLMASNSVIDIDVEIGDFVRISPNVYIGDNCKIGKGCVINAGVTILPGVELGENVYVVAGSVVTHSYAGNVTIAGAPARSVKGNNELHERL